MIEEWKDINCYENLYQISNFGNVRGRRKMNKEGFIKSLRVDGYYSVGLHKNKIRTLKYISRLVLEHFNPIENMENMDSDHIDFNPKNNRLDNLRWLTKSENRQRQQKSIKIEKYDKNNNYITSYRSINNAANENNLNRANIGQCINGIRKTCGGFIWRKK